MTNIPVPYREHHLLTLLDTFSKQDLPLDLWIHRYFRDHPALGSKDRGMIAETAYTLVRWQALLDHLCTPQLPTWRDRYRTFLEADLDALQQQEEIPLPIRLSCPPFLFDLLVNSYGVEKARELCLINNHPAPTTVRTNTLKISRNALLERWKGLYEVSPTRIAPHGIVFHRKINFFQLPEFKEGFFEVQDEGSQLVAALVDAQPGQQVMDYCGGSGGKALAFAPALEGKGQIYVHDVRLHALQEARKRLRRAGIQNSQVIHPTNLHLAKLKKKMDWVLVDAPCSGTGTLRRNPDMKWKYTPEMVERLVGQQRVIFERALSFLHPKGSIVYATCSLLKEENEQQIDHFTRTYHLQIQGTPFQSFPEEGGMDGFFGVVLKRA